MAMIGRPHSLKAILKKWSKIIKPILRNQHLSVKMSIKSLGILKFFWTIHKVNCHGINGRPCMISSNHILVSFHFSRSLKVQCHNANWMATRLPICPLCYQIASGQRLMRQLEKSLMRSFSTKMLNFVSQNQIYN